MDRLEMRFDRLETKVDHLGTKIDVLFEQVRDDIRNLAANMDARFTAVLLEFQEHKVDMQQNFSVRDLVLKNHVRRIKGLERPLTR